MSKYRRWVAGDKFLPSASQANAWTEAAIAHAEKKTLAEREQRSAFRIVKTTEDHPEGETINCTVMTGAKGQEQESDSEIPCFNRFAELPEGTICIAAYIVNGWELLAAPCE